MSDKLEKIPEEKSIHEKVSLTKGKTPEGTPPSGGASETKSTNQPQHVVTGANQGWNSTRRSLQVQAVDTEHKNRRPSFKQQAERSVHKGEGTVNRGRIRPSFKKQAMEAAAKKKNDQEMEK